MYHEGLEDDEIVATLKVSKSAVCGIRKRYCEGGLNFSLNQNPQIGDPKKLDRHVEAHLTLLACSDPQEGRFRWAIRVLAYKLVELEVVKSISTFNLICYMLSNKLFVSFRVLDLIEDIDLAEFTTILFSA